MFWCGQVGTEEGRIVCCSKKAKVQPEVIINTFRGHHGPVRGLQRNPAFSKNFLSVGTGVLYCTVLYCTVQVGDWSARVWADDVLGSSLITINTGTEILTGDH